MRNRTSSKVLKDKEIFENQRTTNIDIHIYINNTNNYTKWYSKVHLLTHIFWTLDTFQVDKSLLNFDA